MTHDFETLNREIAHLEAELAKLPRQNAVLQRAAQTDQLTRCYEIRDRWLAEMRFR